MGLWGRWGQGVEGHEVEEDGGAGKRLQAVV